MLLLESNSSLAGIFKYMFLFIMNMFIQRFINRKNELAFLERQYRLPAAFVVLYGRRRVGKTELVKQTLKNRRSVYLLASQEVEKEIAESFSRELGSYFSDPALEISPFSTFRQMLEYLKGKDLKDLVLAFDEFPYLVDANKAFPSLLQNYWEKCFKEKGLKLVLCGSSIGAMETEVLGRKSPLYGRRTGQWKVNPLPFCEFRKFFPKTDFRTLTELYSITGGIPLYILEINGNKKAYDHAKEVIASRGSLLYQEVEIILKEELREPKVYFSLLKEIASGKNTINEVSQRCGMERTALVRYINILKELDLIEDVHPVTAKEKSKNTIYRLKDNYFKFWFRFVYPFKKDLDSFYFGNFKLNFEQNFNSYLGRQFEEICSEMVNLIRPINFTSLGKWWGHYRTASGERKELEIDLCAINEQTKEILFGECKWQENADAEEILERLKEKASRVEWNKDSRKENYLLFAKSFKNKIPKICFDLNDLDKILVT